MYKRQDYNVASLSQIRKDIDKGPGQGRVKVYQVKEVWPAKVLAFPLKSEYDRRELGPREPTPAEMTHDAGDGETDAGQQPTSEAQADAEAEAPTFDPSTPDEPLELEPEGRIQKVRWDTARVPRMMPAKWQSMSMNARFEAILAEDQRVDGVLERNHKRCLLYTSPSPRD